MKKLNHWLVITGIAFTLSCAGTNLMAQGGGAGGGGGGGFGGGAGGGGGRFGAGGGGGFDMSQLVPMMVEGMRQSLSVTNDDEWKVIEPRLEKVVKLSMEQRTTGMGAMGAMFGNRGGGGGMRRFNALAGDPDPSVDALQQALDNNAPLADVKAAMAKVREARLAKRTALLKAQQELKDVLSVRQEAALLLIGQLE